jgi:L-ornithine N5-oxygenase
MYLTLLDMTHNRESTERYDAVVLATGYRRDVHRKLLEPLSAHLGTFDVDRDYRIRARPGFKPAIFLQGACETTHGLSDTLLSITAVRTAEIGAALLAAAQPAVRATTPGAMRPAAV